ncbi:PAS domain-containing sensor histidine kinase [Leptolyngbya sp. AN03gr2]|uniref:PAS domain-containing sensor histidine kinase n=1 Tax=unclassified Leptolyngbya TaxID=2650499 RepID=UPI003D30F56A
METDLLSQYIQAVQQRTNRLYENARDTAIDSPDLMMICLEELRSALEELHVAEEELRQQNESLLTAQSTIEAERERYQELFEFAPDAYLVTDLSGTVREANRATIRLFELSERHLIQKSLISFVHEDQRSAFREVLNQLPTIHRVQEWEVTMCKCANPIDTAVTVETVRNAQGKAIALRWLIRDITARKRNEAQLRETQLHNLELTESDRLKDQFMATISHELRTPMNAILGFSHLLLKRVSLMEDENLTHMVDRITRNSQHLLGLIEELLDFSKLKANKLQLRKTGFDLIKIASDTVQELRCLADQKGILLNLDIAQPSISIVNDPVRIRQIITNLLSNAIKFTETGQVTLGVWELPEGRVLIAVQDTGIGIEPADQERIFQEFWQVNQSSTRNHGGTGLGLAIVRALAELMQGSISIESKVNQGTTFRVELPRQVQ